MYLMLWAPLCFWKAVINSRVFGALLNLNYKKCNGKTFLLKWIEEHLVLLFTLFKLFTFSTLIDNMLWTSLIRILSIDWVSPEDTFWYLPVAHMQFSLWLHSYHFIKSSWKTMESQQIMIIYSKCYGTTVIWTTWILLKTTMSKLYLKLCQARSFDLIWEA